MSRPFRTHVALLLTVLTVFTGCHPLQPFYFHEDGDLSHYLDQATDLEYPDVETATLEEAAAAHAPITLSDPEVAEYWELTLQDAVSIALKNSKVIRNLGSVTPFGFADALTERTAGSATVYDPAIAETDVEGALSAFDAQLRITGSPNSQSPFLQRSDRPQNVTTVFGGYPDQIQQDIGGIRADLVKRSASGGRFSFSNQTNYERGNNRGVFPALDSFWSTFLEMRVDQPILRGRGAQVNRIFAVNSDPNSALSPVYGQPGVLLRRINTDITLANFEGAVRNLVLDIENTYWDLYFSYRALETAEIGRDSALATWQKVSARALGGKDPAQDEARVREQYFAFRAAVETAFRDLVNAENRLRWLMGLAATDGRLIRPADQPSPARVEFPWREIHAEALVRNAELRQQKWVVKQRELELIGWRNSVLPQLDLGALYRWVGVGDQLINADRNGLDFPAVGSTAWDVLTGGHYQEFAFFFNFEMPVGVRSALANVRRAQLAVARAKAQLEDMELNTSHLLGTAIRSLDSNYWVAQSHFNRLIAAKERARRLELLWEVGSPGERRDDRALIEFLLEAHRTRAQAQFDYYRALSDYSKAIAEVHYRKGTLLDYNNVYLAEGPWAEKAYWDALQKARERDASYYFDYGWTRPRVLSSGPVQQHVGDSVETIQGAEVLPELIPTPAPQPEKPAEPEIPPKKPDAKQPGPITSHSTNPSLDGPAVGKGPAPQSKSVGGQRPADAFSWGGLGLSQNTSAPVNRLRLAAHEEELPSLRAAPAQQQKAGDANTAGRQGAPRRQAENGRRATSD